MYVSHHECFFYLDISNPNLKNKKECNKCSRLVTDLPRHMRLVHKWPSVRTKVVNAMFDTRKKYTWKNGPPERKRKLQEKKTSNKTVPDYHKKRKCGVPNCYSITKRYDAHLRNVHGLKPSSNQYKALLAEAIPVKHMVLLDEIKENRRARARDEIRQNCRTVGAVPNFRESAKKGDIYIAPSKSNLTVINQIAKSNLTLIDEVVKPNLTVIDEVENSNLAVIDEVALSDDEKEAASTGESLTTEQVLRSFEQFLSSVDGGKLDLSTAKSASHNIANMLKVLESDDLSDLLERMNIRNKFLAEYCEKAKYAPLTIKKYLTSLVHFYDFLLNDELPMINYTPDDILRMKVCTIICLLRNACLEIYYFCISVSISCFNNMNNIVVTP